MALQRKPDRAQLKRKGDEAGGERRARPAEREPNPEMCSSHAPTGARVPRIDQQQIPTTTGGSTSGMCNALSTQRSCRESGRAEAWPPPAQTAARRRQRPATRAGSAKAPGFRHPSASRDCAPLWRHRNITNRERTARLTMGRPRASLTARSGPLRLRRDGHSRSECGRDI